MRAWDEAHREFGGPGLLEDVDEEALGWVINFGEQFVKNGIHRVVNGVPGEMDFKPPSKREKLKDRRA